MPRFFTRLVNTTIDCEDDGLEFATAEEAGDAAVLSALDLAKDLLASGERLPQIEVIVSDDTGVVQRRLLTVSVAAVDHDGSSLFRH
jgi:hypothetical protein